MLTGGPKSPPALQWRLTGSMPVHSTHRAGSALYLGHPASSLSTHTNTKEASDSAVKTQK